MPASFEQLLHKRYGNGSEDSSGGGDGQVSRQPATAKEIAHQLAKMEREAATEAASLEHDRKAITRDCQAIRKAVEECYLGQPDRVKVLSYWKIESIAQKFFPLGRHTPELAEAAQVFVRGLRKFAQAHRNENLPPISLDNVFENGVKVGNRRFASAIRE